MLFSKIDGEQAIVIRDGVYRQCDLYEKSGALFAKVAGGYIRLNSNGTTTQPKTRLETLAYDGPLFADRLGRLTLTNGEGYKQLSVSSEGVLLLEGPSTATRSTEGL